MKLNGSGQRPVDWPHLLEHYVERHRATPFAWGQHDCATFAAGWVALARPDLSPQEDFAAEMDYSTAAGAVRALAGHSIAGIVENWGELLRVEPAFAQRGDVVLLDVAGRRSLAVCVGELACGPGTTGMEFVPMTAAVAAWRV